MSQRPPRSAYDLPDTFVGQPLIDELLTAFELACHVNDLETAAELLSVLEALAERREFGPSRGWLGPDERVTAARQKLQELLGGNRPRH